ncbi:uncharacterized protein F54H12.2-like [Dendronephthya gigantea]|uniref:uncharacterized protein F54H12.2-like n=1 Tax=Dendronephthya gigantea TaxID=151771 RepID=UPI00106AB5DC|nr:uncharacterized protein F54H12.2-like [Dendronephthya gigantea]
MNFVHSKSPEGMKSELDLFGIPSTQVGLEKGHWIDHQPVSSVEDGGPITFLCPGTDDYVDLSKTILVVRAKVTKANGQDLDADERVGVVNNFLHSLFKQVDVFLKEKQVTQATGTYAYRAYLETLLNFGIGAKQSQLTAALFYKDTAGKFDVSNPAIAVAANTNYGLKKRYEFSSQSKTIEMAGPIFSDVFFSERLLLSFVDLKVILNRNINEFCLMASEDDADYRVKLMDVYLKIRKVKISPTISMAHEIALKKGPAIYPIRRVECKSFIIPAGNPLRKDNIFNGLVPKSFVCGLVESAGFNGAYKQNPFNFQHFNMSFIGASVNGEEVPLKGMQLSFAGANPRYIEAFYTMFSGTGKMNYNTGNDISRDEYIGGNVLFALDLTPDMCGSSTHFNAVQKGNFAVDVKFSRAPAAAVSLVCYAEFENLIQIDGERNVIYDYTG